MYNIKIKLREENYQRNYLDATLECYFPVDYTNCFVRIKDNLNRDVLEAEINKVEYVHAQRMNN